MKEIINLIRSDYYRYRGGDTKIPVYKILIHLLFGRNYPFNYSFWLRLSHKKNPLYILAKFMHRRLSKKYCLQIPSKCKIGYGLYLGHGICIVINGNTVIGNNVNLSQFLNIGTNHKTPAIIGDDVYIGPNVSIVEDVKIGSNSCIGAGAVVVKDVPENATVAGVPAKVISYKKHDFIKNRWPVS
ncbi:MAG: serine acetyltransferase [Muribaculaceae bacterium]|nr:serine acetyltransferase [Muribaculaceae bacterium]